MQQLSVTLITLGSFVLTGTVVSNAFMQKKQFYPSVVYLTKSNASMAVMYIQGFVFVMILSKLITKLFFGQLRASETEHLMERTWHAVIETCLAFTVFRDEFSPRFVSSFVLLLLLKCFHWLGEDRVDYMERSPIITVLFHARMLVLIGVLSAVDSYYVSSAYFTTLLRGASVQLVFGFEYAILMTVVFMIAIKYILHSIDLRSAHPWEEKAVHLLNAELVLSFVKVVLYAVFMLVMMRLHTFPLFTIRPFYLTVRAFKKALSDVVLSRRAIQRMNTHFPDATAEDFEANHDNVCIICREEMTHTANAKKLPCNHIFHVACLRSWFQRQQTCPTCRMDILTMNPAASRRAPPQAAAAQQQPQAPDVAGAPGPQPNNPFAQFQNAFPFMGPPPQPAGGAHPPAAQGPPPVFPGMPPMGMGFPPFMLPFPTPPVTSAMTDEEVRNMEGIERRAVENRIECLRNMQTLLDAASVQLQQYLSVVAMLPTQSVAAPVVTPQRHGPSPTETPVMSSAEIVKSNVDATVKSEAQITEQTTEQPGISGENASTSEESPNSKESIRLRRLQHFDSQGKL